MNNFTGLIWNEMEDGNPFSGLVPIADREQDFSREEVVSTAWLGFGEARILAEEARHFECTVWFVKGETHAEAGHVFGLLGLSVGPRTRLVIEATGRGATEAVHRFAELVSRGYGINGPGKESAEKSGGAR